MEITGKINEHIKRVDESLKPIIDDYKEQVSQHFYADLTNLIVEYATYEQCHGDRMYGYSLFGRYEGLQIEWYYNGAKHVESEYKNGVVNGKWIEFYDTGQKVVEVEYLNDMKHGMYKLWTRDGQTEVEEEYRNGLREGLSIEYDQTGRIRSEGMYVGGQKSGKWASYQYF